MAINVIQDGEFYNVSFRYNPTIVSMMHNVPGHQWVPEKKVWKIPVKYLGWLIDEFKGTLFEHDVHIYSSEQIHENATIDSTDLSALAKVDISDIHQYVKEGGKLYQHQLDFLRYAKAKNRQGFLLADSMGTGKTLEVINYAIYRRQTDKIKHCLIITCVNTAKYNWKADIHTHTRGEYSGYLLGTRRFKKGPKKGQDRYVTESVNKYEDLCTLHTYGDKSEPELPFFIIMNIQAMQLKAGKHYLIAEKLIELINNQTISMIAIDECHKNMSPQSVQGKLILEIKKRTKQAAQWIPMTGTPIVNKPTDTFTPLKLIDAHDMQSYWHWCQHFVIYGGFGDHEIVGYKNIPKLKEMLSHNMIRRTKEDVLDLPPKNRITIYVESTKYQAELYEQVRADLLPQQEFISQQINPLAQMLKLRQVNGSPELVDPDLVVDKTYLHKNAKLMKLLELLEDITESGEKVIVFSNWVEPLKTLYKFISKKYKVACYTGTMLESQREKHKRVFMTNPEYKIMLGTIGALGTTHTLTAASNIIFYDEPWTAADKEQAEDRIYRVSTTTSVNIYTIITIDTVDDIVHRIVYDKSDMSKYLVDNKLDIRNNPELLTMLLGANPTL